MSLYGYIRYFRMCNLSDMLFYCMLYTPIYSTVQYRCSLLCLLVLVLGPSRPPRFLDPMLPLYLGLRRSDVTSTVDPPQSYESMMTPESSNPRERGGLHRARPDPAERLVDFPRLQTGYTSPKVGCRGRLRRLRRARPGARSDR